MMNLADFAIKQRTFILFFTALSVIAGLFSYFDLGKLEDPSFTIKTAVVVTLYPGASAEEVEQQVTDTVETKLQEMGSLNRLRSLSRPGMSMVFVDLKESLNSKALPQEWDLLRRKVSDMKLLLPSTALASSIRPGSTRPEVSVYKAKGPRCLIEEKWEKCEVIIDDTGVTHPDGKIVKIVQWSTQDKDFNVGGGIVGDVSGFAASIFKRGIKFINTPTTLLAQVDSSIRGKTGINTSSGKNLIGSFYQPSIVISDTNFLKTLPKREIICGYGEILKHSIISNKQFFLFLNKNASKILNLKTPFIEKSIYQSCLIKKK